MAFTLVDRPGRRSLKAFMRQIEEQEGLLTANPVEFLIYVAATGKDPRYKGLGEKFAFQSLEEAVEASRKQRVEGQTVAVPIEGRDYPVNLPARIMAAKSAGNYVQPKLAVSQTTADLEDNDGMEATQVAALAENPEIRQLMERVTELAAGVAVTLAPAEEAEDE